MTTEIFEFNGREFAYISEGEIAGVVLMGVGGHHYDTQEYKTAMNAAVHYSPAMGWVLPISSPESLQRIDLQACLIAIRYISTALSRMPAGAKAPENLIELLYDGLQKFLARKLELTGGIRTDSDAYSRHTGGFVYLLKSPTNAYKIGRSKNPQDRIKTFGVKLPFEVEYLAIIPAQDMCSLEAELHQRFADKRINGEWFALTDNDIAYIKSLEI